MSSFGKDSAQLEREIEEQRQRIEDRVGEIRQRLSPGQLVDEVLSYTKNGGQQFASNFGSTIASNPLPAALLGVSLIWLISGQGAKQQHSETSSSHGYRAESDYPYATVSGGMRRVSHAADDTGTWYSHFEDSTGKRYKAQSNEKGHRIGHFLDDTGRAFGGFIDDTGHRVRDFTDEVGNRFDEATGWASHRLHDVQQGIGNAMGQVAHQAQNLGGAAQHQVDRTSRMVLQGFENQPLVAGALAFAAGAALGAALPHTREEDKLVGEAADKVKSKAADLAADAYEEGKEKAADLYERGKEGAAQLYDEVRGNGAPRGTDYH